MATTTPVCVHPTPEELLPVFRTCFTRATIQQLRCASAPTPQFYWRVFTPVILLWCLSVPRLQHDHTGDAVVSHLHSGAVDPLDPADSHVQPLSQRLRSESTSAYAQGDKRMPVRLIWAVNRHLIQTVQACGAATPTRPTWKGHAVRRLDGTTFRLAPTPELVTTYGQARNQHGDGYWVIVRALATFCLHTQHCTAATEAAPTVSASAMTRTVLEAPDPDTVGVGDNNFGVYRVGQVAQAVRQQVCCVAKPARRVPCCAPMATLARSPPGWIGRYAGPAAPTRTSIQPCRAIPSPVADLVALYGLRWQVESDYRPIKTTMDMDEYTAQTPDMFRKELAAGLLTYNLICATLVQAAQRAHLAPNRLSFQRALRRVRDALMSGVPAWVLHTGQVASSLLDRLAQCRLAHQPLKIAHEPRKVRRRAQVFPAVKGDRNRARQQFLQSLGAVERPAPADQDADAPDRNEAQRKAA